MNAKIKNIIQNKNSVKYLKLAAILLVGFFAVKLLFYHKPEPRKPAAKPVRAALSTTADVPVFIDSFGTLCPLNSVDIKSQVEGKIMSFHFTEGSEVKKGELLFSIDDSEYKAELAKQEAALANDQAQLKLQKDTLERNRSLVQKNLISQQDFEKFETDVDSKEASVKLDQANIELAKIKLQYCAIQSPIDGITGKRQVDPGNIVVANNGPVLVNIKSIDTLYMDFTVSESDLSKIRSAMAENKLRVELQIQGDPDNKFTGELQFMENAVDNTTGTVSLRALVDNKGRKLWAGQFVRTRLILGTIKDAVLVPYEAVQLGQKGYYLFVITPDNKADLRQVQTGSRFGDNIVVDNVVKAGEKIVTSGQMGLSPGVLVSIITDK